jgi:hypothetical protein
MSMAPGFGNSTDSEPEVFIPSSSLLNPLTETESFLPTLTVQVEPLSSEYSIRKSYPAVALKDSSKPPALMLAFRVQSNFRLTLVLVPGTLENECHKQVLV